MLCCITRRRFYVVVGRSVQSTSVYLFRTCGLSIYTQHFLKIVVCNDTSFRKCNQISEIERSGTLRQVYPHTDTDTVQIATILYLHLNLASI